MNFAFILFTHSYSFLSILIPPQAINTLFIFLGLVLVGVAAYGKKEEYLVSIPALGGVIACGVFLTLIAICGVIGAIRHNQVPVLLRVNCVWRAGLN